MSSTSDPGHPGSDGSAPGPTTVSSRTVEGNDAVCFTAGVHAAVIGAGTIHAYLAARRKNPRIVAGISMGALNAAAMQRAYREAAGAGAGPRAEKAARWSWFRRYLESFAQQPFTVLWNAIPDQSDFFADMIPIRDTTLPQDLHKEEAESRRRLYLLVKLGRWLAQLPVTIRLAASGVVNYVRIRERYTLGQKCLSFIGIIGNTLSLMTRIIRHVCFSPQFFPEHKFPESAAAGPGAGQTGRVPFASRFPAVAWLNLFSVTFLWTVMLSLTILILAATLLERSDAWIDTVSSLWKPALAVLAFSILAAATGPIRRAFFKSRPVKKLLRPLVCVAGYIYTIPNLLFVLSTFFGLAWAVGLHAFRRPVEPALVTLLYGLAGLLVTTLLFSPFVVLPETRRWLRERGLLQEWPRPLFGWRTYLFFWIHLLSLVTYVALGIFSLVLATSSQPMSRAVAVALLGAALLTVIPLLPMVLLLLPYGFWRLAKRLAAASTGWHKVGAWALSCLIWILVSLVGIGLFSLAISSFQGLFDPEALHPRTMLPGWWKLFVGAGVVLMLTWLGMFSLLTQPVLRRRAAGRLLENLGLGRSLIDGLHLRLRLRRLFQDDQEGAPRPLVADDPMPVVIVAAPLQTLFERGAAKPAYQLWARPGTPLLDALESALAVPPIFPPVHVEPNQLRHWLKESILTEMVRMGRDRKGIDLVDGSVIRQNPLPALYSYLRNSERAEVMAENTDGEHAAIHVVYGVPVESRAMLPCDGDRSNGQDDAFRNTIVDVGLASLSLSQRRDTQLEVIQSNFISQIESIVPGTSADRKRATHVLFADEIAPREDLVFENPLGPTPEEVLGGIAAGCRRTLETLYRHELAAGPRSGPGCDESVPCRELLVSIGKVDPSAVNETPGLPEVCGRCTRVLQRPAPNAPKPGATASVKPFLSEPRALCREHPQLTGERPRIVFVASGGVFRGAFHIGMLAALRSSNIKPDLIVGSSVGTLMGGALGALFCNPGDVLERLVDTFARVDDTVALTRTLKSAAREMGLRGRAVRLSPRQVRRMVLRGSRSDPGFAAAGAPSALIDAISDLFMIPHKRTAEIAAAFIAGDVTGATSDFIAQLRTETIRRLDIEKAVLGASLLEKVASDLLTGGAMAARLSRQPFQRNGIAYYGTTTNLCTRSAMLLGGNGLHPDAPYDFVEAALASSAFPAVFAPRPESLVFPGTGRSDLYFADGGMFDNLPFLPAIEILCQAQRGYRDTTGAQRTRLDFLRQRLAQPDLLIAGALNAVPEAAEHASGEFRSLAAIYSRANALEHNLKIRAFELASQRVYNQLLRLESARPAWLEKTPLHFVDGVVNAAVLPAFPASPEHLNGTFSFCPSTGLNVRTVEKSIGDGCYQTLSSLARAQENQAEVEKKPELLAAKSVQELVRTGHIPALTVATDMDTPGGSCPFFLRGGGRFACPFARTRSKDDPYWRRMQGVSIACRNDTAHGERQRGVRPAPRKTRSRAEAAATP